MHERIDVGRLVRAVLGRGFTTGSLGRELRLSQPSVSRLGTGKAKKTSADAVVRLIELAGGEVKLPELPAESTHG